MTRNMKLAGAALWRVVLLTLGAVVSLQLAGPDGADPMDGAPLPPIV
jgi:hypothetical protein